MRLFVELPQIGDIHHVRVLKRYQNALGRDSIVMLQPLPYPNLSEEPVASSSRDNSLATPSDRPRVIELPPSMGAARPEEDHIRMARLAGLEYNDPRSVRTYNYMYQNNIAFTHDNFFRERASLV